MSVGPSVAKLSADVTSACYNGLWPTSRARLFLFLKEVEHAHAANHSCSPLLTGQAPTGSELHFFPSLSLLNFVALYSLSLSVWYGGGEEEEEEKIYCLRILGEIIWGWGAGNKTETQKENVL